MLLKARRVETAIGIATAEVTRTDLPHQIAAKLAVITRYRALAGVVIEVSLGRASVECADGIRGQCAEAHRRNVEHAGRIRLLALVADQHPDIVRIDMYRRHRMVDPPLTLALHTEQGTQRALVT